MENPKTLLEKVDAAANLVEQMMLAKTINDDNRFKKAHQEAGKLLFDVMREMEEKGID